MDIKIQGRKSRIPFKLVGDTKRIQKILDASKDGDTLLFEGVFFLRGPLKVRGVGKTYNGQGKTIFYCINTAQFNFSEVGSEEFPNRIQNFIFIGLEPNLLRRTIKWLKGK